MSRQARRRRGPPARIELAPSRSALTRGWLVPAIVALIALIVFAPALRNGFIAWDDDRNFLNNPSYRGLGIGQLTWMWTTFHLGHYVPLSWMTLGLDYSLWGMNPAGYHLTNILLHAATAVVVFFVARRVLDLAGVTSPSATGVDSLLPAAFAALVFAIHPLRVESVAWVTERRDVLSELFATSSVLLYLRAAVEKRSGGRSYWISLTLFACALLSKATTVTLPAVLLLLDVYPLRRLSGSRGWWNPDARRVYLEKIPYAMLAMAIAALSIVALPARPQLSIGDKLAVSAYSVFWYLSKTLVPLRLSPLYPMPATINAGGAKFLASYVIVIGIFALAFLARRRWPGFGIAWLAFIVITLPMLGLVQNGPQIAADRYTYHSGPVLAILAGALFARLAMKDGRMATGIAAALLLWYAALTWRQVEVWRDSPTFWSHVLELEPESALAHGGVAQELASQNRMPEAIAHYRDALRIDPRYSEGENNVGVALARTGNVAEAIVHYRRALAIKPDYDEAHSNLGAALASRGDLANAIEQYRLAIDANPFLADAQFNWGNALFARGEIAAAIEHYIAASRIRPGDSDIANNLMVAQARLTAGAQRAVPAQMPPKESRVNRP
ncbi:MAG: tetratricopeptide repeat protein [bacterium]